MKCQPLKIFNYITKKLYTLQNNFVLFANRRGKTVPFAPDVILGQPGSIAETVHSA